MTGACLETVLARLPRVGGANCSQTGDRDSGRGLSMRSPEASTQFPLAPSDRVTVSRSFVLCGGVCEEREEGGQQSPECEDFRGYVHSRSRI